MNFKKIWKESRKIKEEENLLPQETENTGVEDLTVPDLIAADTTATDPVTNDVVEPAENIAPATSSDATPEEVKIAEAYVKRIESLNRKKAKLAEQVKELEEQINKTTLLGQKKAQYDEARAGVQKLKEEINEIKEDKIPGGMADDMTPEDLAKHHDVPVEEIKKQLDIGEKIEKEHTDDEDVAKEISKDHNFENEKYYDNPEGTDLVDMEKEAEKDKKEDKKEDKEEDNELDESKKNKKKDPVTSISKQTGERERIGHPVTDEDRKNPRKRRQEGKKIEKNWRNLDESNNLKESWNKMNKKSSKIDLFNIG